MFRFQSGLGDRVKLLSPVVGCLIALAAVIGLSWTTIQKVKVGGPLSDALLADKDLTADVLPPPLYLVETQLAVQQVAANPSPASAAKFAAKYKSLRGEYDERLAFWTKSLPEGKLRSIMTGSLNAAALDYFSTVDSEFVPALASGDERRLAVIANGPLASKYEAQRAIVDQAVELVTSDSEELQQVSQRTISTNLRIMVAVAAAVSLVAVLAGISIVTSVTRRLHRALDESNRIQRMIDSSAQNTMFADREQIIRYANPATLRTLRKLEEHLAVKVDRLVGSSIDVLYKNPAQYRRTPGEQDANPPTTLIRLGIESLELRSSPVVDVNREFLGTMVTFDIVTERIALEERVKENADRETRAASELRAKVDTIQKSVTALAAGDFTQTIPDLGSDAVGQMASGLNSAIDSVRNALEGVREVSQQLADAAGQLASASEEISSGAQEQASGLEETASALEEITATVRQNSDSAQQARQLAIGSRDVAEKGGQVVSGAVAAMSEINHSSKKIAEIIGAIDEIAFQTNLLALNAAVEAARAGEQGRGFAVVAAEVRNLAQRSASAAKEIKTLIQDSVKKVDAGSELVNRSGDTLQEIVISVKRVTDIVAEIAAASREQSTGIDQVNKAVTQMDAVTQRNASQTEEMSATAQTLTDQAGQLRDLVGRFKLGQSESRTVRPSGPLLPSKGNRIKPTTKPRPAVARAMAKNGHSSHDLDRIGESDDGFTEF